MGLLEGGGTGGGVLVVEAGDLAVGTDEFVDFGVILDDEHGAVFRHVLYLRWRAVRAYCNGGGTDCER